MDYRILGPLEVDADGVPVELVGGRQSALLAFLLLHANETVPAERLVDELWDGSPPPSAHKILQHYVSRLRRDLGNGPLVTRGRGYELRVKPGELDVDRFAELLEAGRQAMASNEPDVAATTLRRALSLWRGPVLVELADDRFARPQIDRLEELRLAALTERVEADLALGRHVDLVGELEEVTRRHPLQERLCGQLMLALYRSGRQAEALEVYRSIRHALVHQLGIEPGASLQALERAILLHDPALEPPRDVTPVIRGRLGRSPGPRRPLAAAIVALAALALVGAVSVVAMGNGAEATVAPPDSLGVVDPRTNRLADRVGVGLLPAAVAVGDGFVWVLNQGDTTVSKVDTATLRVARTIGLSQGNHVGATAIAYGYGAAWVGDGHAATVTRLSPTWGTEPPIHLSRANSSDTLLVATGAGAVWATSMRHQTVYRVDPVTRRVSARAAVPAAPVAIAAGDGSVWVASIRPRDDPRTHATSGTLSRIDPSTAATVSTLALPIAPSGMAVAFGSVWVTANGQNTVLRIDPRTSAVARLIPVGDGPSAIAAGDGAIWVVNSKSVTISRIDPGTNAVAATIAVHGTPAAITSGDGRIWVTGT